MIVSILAVKRPTLLDAAKFTGERESGVGAVGSREGMEEGD